MRITRDGNLSFVVVVVCFVFGWGLTSTKKRIRFIRYWAGLEVCVLQGGGGGEEGEEYQGLLASSSVFGHSKKVTYHHHQNNR